MLNFAKSCFNHGVEYLHLILGNAIISQMLLKILEHMHKAYSAAHHS